MRADMTAAYFDCRDTAELIRCVSAGEVLPPTATRGSGQAREPIWAFEACQRFIARRHQIAELDAGYEDLAELI